MPITPEQQAQLLALGDAAYAASLLPDDGTNPPRSTVYTPNLPASPPQTVATLIAALTAFDPETPVLTPAPDGGLGDIRIITTEVRERRGQPRGEGRYARRGQMSKGDVAVGEVFDAVIMSWEDDQRRGR